MSDLEAKTRELKKRLRSAVLTKEWLERMIISVGLYGRVSGVIGPYIIANLNGQMIIRLRPKNFQMSQTNASIANRKSMASANKFAMFLKDIDSLYEVWGKSKTAGLNAFTTLIKHNKKHFIDYHPSVKNVITPDGHSLIADNLVSVENNLKIKISNDYSAKKDEKLVIIMVGCNPLKKGNSDFECIKINNSSRAAGSVIKLTRGQKSVMRNYSKFIIYYALVRKEETRIFWSNTSVITGNIELDENYDRAEAMGYGQILTLSFCPASSTILVKPPG